MLRSFFLLLLFSCLGVATLSSQATTHLDSLEATCNAYPKADTVKMKMLNLLAELYQKVDPGKGVKAADEAISIARNFNLPLPLAEACNKKGANLSIGGDYKAALPCYEEALRIYESLGNQKLTAGTVNNIGSIYYYTNDLANALIFFERAYKAQLAVGDKVGSAKALGNLGNVSMSLNDYPKALAYYDQAIAAHEKYNNMPALGNVLSNKGAVYNLMDEYPKALDCFYKAQDIFQKNKLTIKEADNKRNIGTTYYLLTEYEKSVEYTRAALAMDEKIGNKRKIATDLVNLANCYRSQKNFAAGFESLQRALPLMLEVNDEYNLALCYSQIGGMYYDQSNYSLALENDKKALAVMEKLGNHSASPTAHRTIGDVYVNAPDSILVRAGIPLADRDSLAEQEFTTALQLAKQYKQPGQVSHAWKGLTALYEKTAQYRKAYDAFSNYVALKDSILGEEVKKQVTRKEIQYEFDKKEASLKFEQQLTLEQLEQQKLLSIQQQQSLKLNEQSLVLSNKEKDLQHLAFLKEQAEKQEKEQQLSLAEKDKQLQDVQLGSLIQEKALQLKTLAEKNALIGFLVAGILAILLAFSAFYWWIKQRQAQKEAVNQAQFTRKLLENIEDDRGRIAIDLHDSVSHELLLLKQSIRKEITGPEVGNKIDNIINGIRQISRNLHPVMLDKIGLGLSLETLCEQFMQHETMYISHEIEYHNTLPKPAELQLFRIVQEGLTNALKYSKAEAVKVQLKSSGNTLRLEIQDNGKGFNVEKALEGGKAFGLHSIIQRAKAMDGKAEILSAAGGTTISVVIGA